jgi:hypothetical protein
MITHPKEEPENGKIGDKNQGKWYGKAHSIRRVALK